MKDKILFWLDSTFTQFGTAKYLEKKMWWRVFCNYRYKQGEGFLPKSKNSEF